MNLRDGKCGVLYRKGFVRKKRGRGNFCSYIFISENKNKKKSMHMYKLKILVIDFT